ncbi:UNVERIFIED_CONTAM: hypothetical protein Slati_1890500 [Sesamum latifolium]|uniref:Uncharacterized protein n=1 Tax=Sesamum latifolium TaxID=2727402 RepID=A0AAW2X695_9LAMI
MAAEDGETRKGKVDDGASLEREGGTTETERREPSAERDALLTMLLNRLVRNESP